MRKLKIKHLKLLILHTVKFSLKLTACMTSGRSNNLGGPMVIKFKFEVNSRKNIFHLQRVPALRDLKKQCYVKFALAGL